MVNPVVDEWKFTADGLLNQSRANVSREAQYSLRMQRVIVPDNMAYHSSGSTKVMKALSDVTMTGGEYGRSATESITAFAAHFGTSFMAIKRYQNLMIAGEMKLSATGIDVKPLGPNFIETGWGHNIRPNGLLARLIHAVGLPKKGAITSEIFAATVLDERKLSGDAELYARLYNQAQSKGQPALDDLRNAFGFTVSQFNQLAKFADNNVGTYGLFTFALNPRRFFYLNLDTEARDAFFTAGFFDTKVSRQHKLMALAYGFMFPDEYLVPLKQHVVVSSPRAVALYARR
jgi:hypothetical protein